MSYYDRVISEINGYDFNVCNNVRDILHNPNVVASIVKFIAHGPMGNLI